MVPLWVTIVVGLVCFWLGYAVCGLLVAASRRDDDYPMT